MNRVCVSSRLRKLTPLIALLALLLSAPFPRAVYAQDGTTTETIYVDNASAAGSLTLIDKWRVLIAASGTADHASALNTIDHATQALSGAHALSVHYGPTYDTDGSIAYLGTLLFRSRPLCMRTSCGLRLQLAALSFCGIEWLRSGHGAKLTDFHCV